MRQTSTKCAAAQQGPTGRGKGFPLGVSLAGWPVDKPCSPAGLTGGLPTGSRFRRTHTPNWMQDFTKEKRQQSKRFTIRAHARVRSTCRASTYLSGKSVQTNRATSAWAVENAKSIELFYLPSYSPELNPEERLNADLKHAISSKVPVRTKAKLRQAATEHMTMLEQTPQRVKKYFGDPKVAYAAS